VRVRPPQQPWRLIEEARARQQLWRAEREDAVERELRVGVGPEVRRPAHSGVSDVPEVKQP
ncbi:MAG: hypothetical protein ACRD3S_02845, partial [Terracidiphilus sp.]